MQVMRKSGHFSRDDVYTPSYCPINNSSSLSTKPHKLNNPRTRPCSQKATMQTKAKPRRSSTNIVDTALFMATNGANAKRDNDTKCLCRITLKLTRRRINQTHYKQTQGPNTILNMSARSADTEDPAKDCRYRIPSTSVFGSVHYNKQYTAENWDFLRDFRRAQNNYQPANEKTTQTCPKESEEGTNQYYQQEYPDNSSSQKKNL